MNHVRSLRHKNFDKIFMLAANGACIIKKVV